ncbi:hypothetical protein NF212_00285 [Parasalinivibrio latis]|uniref:hypothetical protein n=1 Tax=Parasalinivibrio latis TaxID=2952610 RepID=UPI0030E1FFC2
MMLINSLNIVSWLLFISSLLLFHHVRPEVDYGVVRYFGLDVRREWMEGGKLSLYSVLGACTAFSVIAFSLRKKRSRRRSDSRGYNLVSLALFSISFILLISL